MAERWGGWLMLISLAIATTLLLHNLGEDFQAHSLSSQPLPDYTLSRFTTTSMDEQGLLKQQVTADSMIHYPTTNTELTKPYIMFYKGGQPTWTVQAEQGQISPDNNQIWLLGATTFQKQMTTAEKAITILSKDVLVKRDIEYAETQAPTTIQSGYGETHSVGMRVFMATEQVELVSNVRGQYVVQ